jgi:hypothetical protein
VLIIENSILSQGPFSSNGQLIGYALEGRKYNTNNIMLKENLFLLERVGYNKLLATDNLPVKTTVVNNLIISSSKENDFLEQNLWFSSREDASLVSYPFLPATFCENKHDSLCIQFKQPTKSK